MLVKRTELSFTGPAAAMTATEGYFGITGISSFRKCCSIWLKDLYFSFRYVLDLMIVEVAEGGEG